MIAAHCDQEGAAFYDPPRGLGHAGEIASFVGALDHDIASVGHRHADEMPAICLDVVPAQSAVTGRRTVPEHLPRREPHRGRARSLAGAVARLRRPRIERHTKKRGARFERAQVASERHAEERARRHGDQVC